MVLEAKSGIEAMKPNLKRFWTDFTALKRQITSCKAFCLEHILQPISLEVGFSKFSAFNSLFIL
jgi:hypothetical protein